MKMPGWLQTALDEHARLVLEGEETSDYAVTSLRVLIRDDHREFGNALIDAFTKLRLLAAIAAASPAPSFPPATQTHLTLFPEAPYRLKITPSKYKDVPEMNAHDLEMAKAILDNKTQNAIDGAVEERRKFSAMYDRVHPLMRDGETVADVELRLASEIVTA